MKMGQLFDNSFTLRYWSLKLSLSLHKQIKSAAFEGQDRYCIISSDWCIISSVVTVPLSQNRVFSWSGILTWKLPKSNTKDKPTQMHEVPVQIWRATRETRLPSLLRIGEKHLGTIQKGRPRSGGKGVRQKWTNMDKGRVKPKWTSFLPNVARMNHQPFKLVSTRGEYTWLQSARNQ